MGNGWSNRGRYGGRYFRIAFSIWLEFDDLVWRTERRVFVVAGAGRADALRVFCCVGVAGAYVGIWNRYPRIELTDVSPGTVVRSLQLSEVLVLSFVSCCSYWTLVFGTVCESHFHMPSVVQPGLAAAEF